MSFAQMVIEKAVYPVGKFTTRAALSMWGKVSERKPHFTIGGLPEAITAKHLTSDARLYATREDMLDVLPKGGKVAEVGTFKGAFAREILDRCGPTELHLFDISFDLIPADRLKHEVESGRVTKHQGDSSTQLQTMPDGYFDWIYIDGDHNHDGVRKDVVQADRKLKAGGYMMFNDYVAFDPLSGIPFGVIHVVNQLCVSGRYEVVGFALHRAGFNDILLRKKAG